MSVEVPDFRSCSLIAESINLHGLKAAAPTTYRGEPLREAQVDAAGLIGAGVPDRWAVIGSITDRATRQAHFVSQRGKPVPGSTTPYPGDSALTTVATNIEFPGILEVNVPGFNQPDKLNVFDADPDDDYWDVDIHGRPYRAVMVGTVAAGQLADFLHAANPDAPRREIGIFAAPLKDEESRLIRSEYQLPHTSHRVRGADGTALHAVFDETLRGIQERTGLIDEEINNARARANFVFSGLSAGDEDYITALRTGQDSELVLDAVGPSGRCKVTEINPKTGNSRNIVLRALAQAARRGISAATEESGVFWGIGLQPRLEGARRVRVSLSHNVEAVLGTTSNVLPSKKAARP